MRILLHILLVSAVSSALVSSAAAQIFRRNVPRRTPSVQRSASSLVQETKAVQEIEKQYPPLVTPPQTIGRTVDVDEKLPDSPQYLALLEQRYELQKNFEGVVFLYRQTRIEVHERIENLKKHLEIKNESYNEAIKTKFVNVYNREENRERRQGLEMALKEVGIPELRNAYSYWKENLRSCELLLMRLEREINEFLDTGILEESLAVITIFENSVGSTVVLDENRRATINRLMAEVRVANKTFDSNDSTHTVLLRDFERIEDAEQTENLSN